MAEIDERDETFLRVPTVIGGKPMRTISPGTYRLLQKVGNLYVTESQEGDGGGFRATTEWVLMHTIPYTEACSLADDIVAWRAKVDELEGVIPLVEILRAGPIIRRDLHEVRLASVDVLPGKEEA